jgi:hypothetical protein
MAEYQVLNGMSVFDVAIKTYGSVSMAVQLVLDNPAIFPDFNTAFPGIAYYDESLVVAIVPGIQLTSDAVDSGDKIYTGIENQSIFDVALMTLGTIDRVVEMIRNSDNLPLSYILAKGRNFNFNLNKVSDLNLYIFLTQPGTAAGGTIDMATNVTGKSYQDAAYSSGYD